MARALVVAVAAFVVQIFVAALCVPLGSFGVQILIAPAALILVATQFTLAEALASMLVFGFLLDCWVGSLVGITMSILAFLTFCAIGAVASLGRPNYIILTAFIFIFSLAFRICVALALGIQGGSQGNWEWTQIVLMPFLDVAFGLLFYKVIMRVLTLFGLCEVREDTSQRLARRSPRIRLE
jgi:hypothetical protein